MFLSKGQRSNLLIEFASSRLTILMWGICCVCTVALTVAKTSCHYDRFAISVPARSLLLFDLAQKDGKIRGPKGPRGTRGNGSNPRHVLYFSIKLFLRHFDLFPKNQNFEPRCFETIQKLGMSTRGLTLIFDPVLSTYFLPPRKYLCPLLWKSLFIEIFRGTSTSSKNCAGHGEFR